MSKSKKPELFCDANGLLLHSGDAIFVMPGKMLALITGFTKNGVMAAIQLLSTTGEPDGNACVECNALRLRSVFDYAKDGQHLTDARAEQDGLGREGWASIKPGQTKYHHYGADGTSKCSYQRQPGPLTFHPNPEQLTPAECCSSCDLHILKAEQAAAIKPAPKSDRLRVGWASIDTPESPYHFWNSNGAKVCTYEGEHRPRFFYPGAGMPKQAEACPSCWAFAHPATTAQPQPRPTTPAPQQLSLF